MWERLIADREAPPERLYNEGVARFRASEFDAASMLFASAAARAKASLSSRAMYNRGTTSLAEAVRAMQASAGPTPQGEGADARTQAMETLQRSLRELKDAVRADPTDRDARANAELAHRVLKELQQQQQQQDQDQQNQDQQDQDPQDQDQQDQDQQNQDQQNKDQQNKDQQNKDQQNQDQQNQDQQNQDQQDQDQQNQDQQNQDQQNPDQQEARKPMSKQDIERLLQRIRDRERARIREVLDRERARTKPAPKDW